MAFTKAEIPVYARTLNNGVGLLNAATAGAFGATTNAVTVYTAGAFGGRVESLVANSDDTAAVNLNIMLVDGSSNVYPLGSANVPIQSGSQGTINNTDLLANGGTTLRGMLVDPTGKRYISVPAGWTLRVSTIANMTAAKKCYVTAQGFDYTDLA